MYQVLDGAQIPCGNGKFWAGRRPIVRYGTLCSELCKMAEPIKMSFGFGLGWAQLEANIRLGFTLAPPGEYHWTVHVLRRCGLLSNYYDHLFLLAFLLTCCCTSEWQVKVTIAVQPVATCRQSPYFHKPAIAIVTSFSLRRSQPPFSLWRHSHCDVIRYCPLRTYERTYVRTDRHLTAFIKIQWTEMRLVYMRDVWMKGVPVVGLRAARSWPVRHACLPHSLYSHVLRHVAAWQHGRTGTPRHRQGFFAHHCVTDYGRPM